MTRLPFKCWEADVDRLLNTLNPWLKEVWQTELVASNGEPYYRPARQSESLHQIEFAHGYFNSALHELAHWCIAGEKRRTLPDYGYWYAPDGRNAEQQAQFETVEVKPQAIEWHFALACQRGFRVSIDNLNGSKTCETPFKKAVVEQALNYSNAHLPTRAANISQQLSAEFGGLPQSTDFTFQALGLG